MNFSFDLAFYIIDTKLTLFDEYNILHPFEILHLFEGRTNKLSKFTKFDFQEANNVETIIHTRFEK